MDLAVAGITIVVYTEIKEQGVILVQGDKYGTRKQEPRFRMGAEIRIDFSQYLLLTPVPRCLYECGI